MNEYAVLLVCHLFAEEILPVQSALGHVQTTFQIHTSNAQAVGASSFNSAWKSSHSGRELADAIKSRRLLTAAEVLRRREPPKVYSIGRVATTTPSTVTRTWHTE
jgi:hypothetical protein